MVNYIKNSAKYISLDKILFGTEHAHNNKGKKKKAYKNTLENKHFIKSEKKRQKKKKRKAYLC